MLRAKSAHPVFRYLMKRTSQVGLLILFVILLSQTSAGQWGTSVENALQDSVPRAGDVPASSRAARDTEASWNDLQKLTLAKRAWETKRFRIAEDLLSDITTSTESSVLLADAWLELGKVNTAIKNYGSARLYLNQAIRQAEYDADEEWVDTAIVGEALYWIGVSHLLEPPVPMYEQAIRCLDSSAIRYPGNPRAADALLILGMLREGREDYDGALKAYRAINDRYPESNVSGMAAIRAAQTLILLGRERDAVAQLDTNVYRLPIEPVRGICADCELLRGNAFLALQDYPSAERSFLTVLDQGDQHHHRQALLGLADTYLAAQRIDSALALYGRLISDTIADRAAMMGELHYAIALADAGKDSLALVQLLKAGSRPEPGASSLAMFELARRAYARREYAEAIKLLDSSIVRAPNSELRARAGHLRGAALMAQAQPEAAAVALHKADSILARIPPYRIGDMQAFETRNRLLTGIALEQSGRHAEAITTLNRYLQLVPNGSGSSEALYWLAEAYYQSKLYQSAAQSLEDLIERFPAAQRVEQALYMLGWAYFKQAKYDRAEAAYSQLIKAYPLSPRKGEARARRADCLFLRKSYAESARAYREARTDTVNNGQREYALYQEALASFRSGAMDSAVTLFSSYANSYPESIVAADAALMAGVAELDRDSVFAAIANLHRFTTAYGNSRFTARAYMTLGDAYTKENDPVAAVAAYKMVALMLPPSLYSDRAKQSMEQLAAIPVPAVPDSLAPENRYPIREIALPRADLLLNVREGSQALESFRRLAARDSSRELSPRFLYGSLRGMIVVGDTAGLVDTLNTLVAIYPGSSVAPAAMLSVARAVAQYDTTRAVELCNRLGTLYPTSLEAGEGRLLEADLLGDAALMRRYLRSAAERLDSTDIGGRLWLRLANSYAAPADADSARIVLEHVAQRTDSVGAEAIFRLTEGSESTTDVTAAVARLEEMVLRFASFPEIKSTAQIRLAELYGRMGQIERARALYQTIVKERPNDHFGVEARDRLQSLIRQ